MSINKRYVPILRIKDAELKALSDLNLQNIDKSLITPLLEIVPTSFFKRNTKSEDPINTSNVSTQSTLLRSLSTTFPNNEGKIEIPPAKVLTDITKKIFGHWGCKMPIFIDGWHIEEIITLNQCHPLTYLGQIARTGGLKIIPVTGLTGDKRTQSYQSAVKNIIKVDKRGVCIRLHVEDTLRKDFPTRLTNLLEFLDISYQETDLIIDYQLLDLDSVPSFSNVSQRIPEIERWRSLILASGAFFEYSSEVTKFETHKWPRNDWLFWKSENSSGNHLKRSPSYSDYTVQYPYYREPPDGAIPSANIRYVSESYWLVLRGNQLKEDTDYEQFPALATELCRMNEFSGEDFSLGDKYIYNKSQELQLPNHAKQGNGNAKTWLQAAINRHITFVNHQLANLPDF